MFMNGIQKKMKNNSNYAWIDWIARGGKRFVHYRVHLAASSLVL
jgi:hypothetical protein